MDILHKIKQQAAAEQSDKRKVSDILIEKSDFDKLMQLPAIEIISQVTATSGNLGAVPSISGYEFSKYVLADNNARIHFKSPAAPVKRVGSE